MLVEVARDQAVAVLLDLDRAQARREPDRLEAAAELIRPEERRAVQDGRRAP